MTLADRLWAKVQPSARTNFAAEVIEEALAQCEGYVYDEAVADAQLILDYLHDHGYTVVYDEQATDA